MSDYPQWICTECGPKYGKRPHSKTCSTFHLGICGVCGVEAIVTEPRDYGHLNDDWKKKLNEMKLTNKNNIKDAKRGKMPAIKWMRGRLRERAGEGWTCPLVWWVRETEAKQKIRDLMVENKRLLQIIKNTPE